MNEDWVGKYMYEGRVNGPRGRGRWRKSWWHGVNEILKKGAVKHKKAM